MRSVRSARVDAEDATNGKGRMLRLRSGADSLDRAGPQQQTIVTVHTLFVDPIQCGPAFANFLDQTLNPVDFALTSRHLHALLRGNRVMFELLKVNYLFMNLLP